VDGGGAHLRPRSRPGKDLKTKPPCRSVRSEAHVVGAGHRPSRLTPRGDAHTDIVREGDRPTSVTLLLEFCELIVRMQAVGLSSDYSVELPLTQSDIADALGLSTVHVNRTLQEIRSAGSSPEEDSWPSTGKGCATLVNSSRVTCTGSAPRLFDP
jgi:hypothetical protein